MIFSVYELFLLFFVYSFCGWCVEVIYVALTCGDVENRGFLNGPICPIYGFGMIGVLSALLPVKNNWILLFIGGAVICSIVEFVGGFALDKIFHMRWWDYSDRPLNLCGYVCLLYSIMWGMAVLLSVKFIHPSIILLIDKMPKFLGYIFIVTFSIIFVVDMIVTLRNLMGIKQNLGQLEIVAKEMRSIGDQLKDVVGNSVLDVADKAGETREVFEENIEESREKFIRATEVTHEKLVKITESSSEKLSAQMAELEEKRLQIAQNIQKYNKKTLNKLPNLNKLGKSINIREYINSFKYKK